MALDQDTKVLSSALDSPTYGQDVSFRLDKPVGSASISPCGRDIVLASRQGLHIIDLDSPYSPPRYLPHHTPWEVADVQWSPFSSRDSWVVSTSSQKALLWNLEMKSARSSIEHVLHGHTRAITDINFSAHHPDILATCAVDSFVHCWDIRHPRKPAISFCDWFAGATQVKWNRQDSHIVASSHDKSLHIWDDRKGAYPLRSIKAHSTKIYGVDWDRTDTRHLVTCSLDRTIKFWDYTINTEEADHTVHTPFPVWRARYTPFGTGLLAMPQREDNDLHLYNWLTLTTSETSSTSSPVHSFDGHEKQVKEFLWRPRGTITEGVDNREFQLVSWGSDRVLRLHRLGEETLKLVGYERGQKPRAHLNFTRKNAVYKTFREAPLKPSSGQLESYFDLESNQATGMRGRPIVQSMNKSLLSGLGARVIDGIQSGVSRGKPSQDMDPISWMKGVKIGKHGSALGPMQESFTSVLSPSHKASRIWERFESLGEEITHVGEKFSKVNFEEIDMLNRRFLMLLFGPWGPERKIIWVKCRIKFPEGYPESAIPSFAFEDSPGLMKERQAQIVDEVSQISVACQEQQLSSLETNLRYLLGERTLEESLDLIKSRLSHELETILTSAQSSSDEDEDDTDRQAQALDTSQTTLAVSNSQYNVPSPKACGALWANDGRLICFFPHKEEKPQPFFDSSSLKASERSWKSYKTVFESFGQVNKRQEQSRSQRSLFENPDSDSSSDSYSYSSSASSSSMEGINLTHQVFLPSIGLPDARLGKQSETFLDESQWSSGEVGAERAIFSNQNYVSLHDYQELLPSRPDLARKYVLSGDSYYCCTYNARIAEKANLHDLAEIWSLLALLVQDQISIATSSKVQPNDDTATQAANPLRSKDSAIDLSFDSELELPITDKLKSVIWGQHPFGREWLVEELMAYYENLADIQMLAMLSCVLGPDTAASSRQRDHSNKQDQSPLTFENHVVSAPLLSNESVDESRRLTLETQFFESPYQRRPVELHQAPAPSALARREHVPRLSSTTTPSLSFRQSRTNSDIYAPETMPLSTSPEQLRNVPRSNSNLASAFAASLSRPFSFTTSASSSPPTYPRKRPSPVGSYIGALNTNFGFGGPASFSKPPLEKPRTTHPLSTSNTEETVSPRRPIFSTKLKNQDRFEHDTLLLAAPDHSRYEAYRAAYAEMLFAWELPIQMCEVLKYNTAQSPNLAHPSSTPSTIQGLDFKTTPSTKPSPLICTLCTSLIRGLASPCLSCGHVLHASCRTLLESQPLISPSSSSADNDQEEQLYTCPSGCGCLCNTHTSIQLPSPEPDLPTRRPRTNTIATASIDSKPTERPARHDIAYESLARNLEGGSAGRQVLSRRSSQIWRGGEGEPGRDRKRSVGSSLRYEESRGLL